MKQQIITVIGKSVRTASRLRGGGSALPGLVVERLDPKFLGNALSQLPHGVIIITGTNGKTTTTKMLVELLQSQGLSVFTNRTGSNFTRGIVAAVIESSKPNGTLPFDVAVLELDEAYAVKFLSQIKPKYCLLLNVFRDQLDRFGEIDATANMLQQVAEATTNGVVINRDDPRLNSIQFKKDIKAPVYTYGVSRDLAAMFPSDDTMRSSMPEISEYSASTDTCLEALDGQTATIAYSGKEHTLKLQLKGIYNIQNATGAVALTRLVMGDQLNNSAMLSALSAVKPAFGRGEDITVNGDNVELVLVKNPSGFRLSLASFSPANTATMVAINDDYADGRDMSWLWDVEFDSLRANGVAMVSGLRGYDMALRLQYDEVPIDIVEPDIEAALKQFVAMPGAKRIYCSYTAMLTLRRQLSKIAKVEKVL